MSNFSDITERANELAEDIIADATQVRTSVLGIDARAARNLFVGGDYIAVDKAADGSLQYYGGFEYVDKEYRVELGGYVFYGAGDSRVADHLSRLEPTDDELAACETVDTMPPGEYWVGDLCYVMHKEWEEVCELTTDEHNCKEGVFTLKDGRRFAMLGTAFGDGEYRDRRGHEYGVDSGTLGCIRVIDIDLDHEENDLDLGHRFTFDNEFTVNSEDGVLCFGKVCIVTGEEQD